MLSVRRPIVIEQLVICAALRVNLVHILLHNSRQSVIIWVAGLSRLEENIRILSGTSLARMVGIQGMLAESGDRVPVSHLSQVVIIPGFDLLNLVRGTETIKEINKRNLALDGSQMSHGGQIHNFLDTGLTQQGAAGLTARVHVGMVAENRQSVAGQSAGRYVDNTRQLLAGNLVQVRNHQQQTL